MSYKITYSKAFKKHYKKLSDTEKSQIRGVGRLHGYERGWADRIS